MAITSQILDLFRDRVTQTQIPEPGLQYAEQAVLPDADPDDLQTDLLQPPIADFLGLALMIDYVDSKGEESRRRITINAVEDNGGNLLVHAYCYERKAKRTFRADRIVSATDLASGVIVDDPQAIIRAISGLGEAPRDSREKATVQAMKNARPGLAVLLFLSRCDGEQHTSEDGVMLEYLDLHCPEPGLDEYMALEGIRKYRPNEVAFERALSHLSDSEEGLSRVLRYVRKLIDADGVITEEEAAFAVRLSEISI